MKSKLSSWFPSFDVAGYVRRTLSGCRIRRIDAQFTSPEEEAS